MATALSLAPIIRDVHMRNCQTGYAAKLAMTYPESDTLSSYAVSNPAIFKHTDDRAGSDVDAMASEVLRAR